jgi:membrane protease YdiL (CAAX protease family)
VIPLWIPTNEFGEEIGWRGFLLPALQRQRSAFKATLILWPIWVGWHIPAIFYLPSYKAIGVAMVPALALSILAGSILLTWLANGSGSLLAVVIWHGLFNVFTASEASHGTVAMVMSIVVMAWAALIVIVARWDDLATPRGRSAPHRIAGTA